MTPASTVAPPAVRLREHRRLRPVRRALVALPLLAAAATSAGWHLAEHPNDQLFSSCTVVGDRVLLLGYSYGVGDMVAMRVEETREAVVVGLHLDAPRGARTAPALSGQLQYVVHSGLNGRPVVTEDGRGIHCTPLQRMP
ncbi:MAG TPA: hypothetical protein VK964_01540 [Nocardioidaceae bacterium]|nr:hypothetical protein [Nocardioidaceae bacterium]